MGFTFQENIEKLYLWGSVSLFSRRVCNVHIYQNTAEEHCGKYFGVLFSQCFVDIVRVTRKRRRHIDCFSYPICSCFKIYTIAQGFSSSTFALLLTIKCCRTQLKRRNLNLKSIFGCLQFIFVCCDQPAFVLCWYWYVNIDQ